MRGNAVDKNTKIKVYQWDKMQKEQVRQGVSRAGFRGENVLMVMNWLEPGMETRPHSHPFEQLVYIVQGRMRFVIEDESFELDAGSLIRIPPGAEHYGEPVGDQPVMNLDVFSPIRDDYLHLVEYQATDFVGVETGRNTNK